MKYIADDLVRVKLSKGEEVVLGWGDPVEVDATHTAKSEKVKQR